MIATLAKYDFQGKNPRLVGSVDFRHNGEIGGVSAVLWPNGHLCVHTCVTVGGETLPAQTHCSRKTTTFKSGFFVGGKDFTITVKNGRLFVR